jgi:hypothetical protein
MYQHIYRRLWQNTAGCVQAANVSRQRVFSQFGVATKQAHRPKIFWAGCLILGCSLFACTPTATDPTPTPIVIAKVLATAYISPTPNPEQIATTRAASSPTPIPVSPTSIPTPTAYIGVFIGEAANQDGGFSPITAPLFGPQANNVAGFNPTADATRCPIPINPVYLDTWARDFTVSQALGCPIQENFGFFGEVQIFENGAIYWRRDTREVWAIVPQSDRGRYWFVAAPEFVSTEGITAPTPGLLVPVGDVGSVWMSVAGLREALGYAQTERQSVAMNIQRYDSGSFFLDATAGQIFALVVDGTAYGPFNAPRPGEEPQLPASAADLLTITVEPPQTPTTVAGP